MLNYKDYINCIVDNKKIRLVMECIYCRKFTQAQTAELLNTSITTVYNLHKQGCRTINEIIAKEDSNYEQTCSVK